jgi:hypothetical protein
MNSTLKVCLKIDLNIINVVVWQINGKLQIFNYK